MTGITRTAVTAYGDMVKWTEPTHGTPGALYQLRLASIMEQTVAQGSRRPSGTGAGSRRLGLCGPLGSKSRGWSRDYACKTAANASARMAVSPAAQGVDLDNHDNLPGATPSQLSFGPCVQFGRDGARIGLFISK